MENLNKRISQLQKEFRQKGIDLCLLLYSRDILYYAGTTAPGVLLITPEDAILFVRRGYEFAKEEATIKSVVKGTRLEEVANHLKNFMGYDEEVRGRFIGHGLGLELDEPPILGPEDETIIKKNMTFSIEINTIVPQFGAIKIEEDIIVKKKGCELLSRIERKLFEVDRT